MTRSVHDNWLYAHWVDHDRGLVVLHTVYPHCAPPEYTDLVFEGVVAHHFEQQQMGEGPNPSNVLFDVEETTLSALFVQYGALLARTQIYGWPLQVAGLEALAAALAERGARCFEIDGTVGLRGFVFARSLRVCPRAGRAQLGAPGDPAPGAGLAQAGGEPQARGEGEGGDHPEEGREP